MTKKVKTTHVSPKQKLAEYKDRAIAFINTLRYPKTTYAFSVKTYEVTPSGKKPNAISAPELAAIAGTAAQLGKDLKVSLVGTGDTATLNFIYVDSQAIVIPTDLL